MNILITGGAGFIGSQLAHELVKRGENVTIVDNFSYGKEDNLIFDDMDLRDYVKVGDILNLEFMETLFKENNFDYVYNIAGIAPLPDCQMNPSKAIETNVSGLVNVLELSRIYGVKTVIQASTNALYENEKSTPFYEKFNVEPTLIYPNTKRCAEIFAKSYVDTYDMNVVCVRFANVYGPHIDCLRKQPPFVAYMIKELYYGNTPTFYSDGTQKRDYIYVSDLIDLIVKVRNTKGFNIVNCASNKSYSVNELYEIACELTNKNIKPNYNDPYKYWDKYPKLYEGEYSINPQILQDEVNKYTLCSNEKAFKEYDWKPKVDIREGLKKVIDYEFELLSKQK